MKDLPIYPYLDQISTALLASPSHFLVLTAETAAGKSTAVPIALLGHVPGKIVMLEPRRIATVAVASRIAELLGEETGETAGYRLHLESKVSASTRIEIITEAILTRRLQNDPSLDGVSVVILDEFHERSVHADLALAFLRESMSIRNDLFVIVMSATIDTTRIAGFLESPVFSVPGRIWPVEIRYEGPSTGSDGRMHCIEDQCARAVKKELAQQGGDILVFLPGIAEIRRTEALLSGCGAEVLILHSSVPFAEQKRVLEGSSGARRVILSSSIAETSITVPGVTVVVDSGLSRIGKLDIPTGMYTLKTGPESVFSAAQRSGRAGRLGPGKCVRLWAEHDVRISETPPEILRTDLLSVVLECALWGVTDISALHWLDTPNAGSWMTARELLENMGALDQEGRITDRGRKMSGLGVHPRIAAVALAGNIEYAVRYSQYSGNQREQERFRADLARRIRAVSGTNANTIPVASPVVLLSGFPDRIARHTGNGVYQFPSGRLASLPKDVRSATARYPLWIVAPEVDAGEREGRIYSFEPIGEKVADVWLELHSGNRIDVSFTDGKYAAGAKIRKTEYRMYGKLVLGERRLEAKQEDIAIAVCDAIRKEGLGALPWSKASDSFLVRAEFCFSSSIPTGRYTGTKDITFTDMSSKSLLDDLEKWLIPFLPPNGIMTEENLLDALRYRTDARAVDSCAPERICLSNGVNRPLVYEKLASEENPVPVLEIKIQDLFGCAETPLILGHQILLRLLSPARRPLQITTDLPGFWKNTWPEVRKEMKGRYPKHKWPEDPLCPGGIKN